MNRHLVFTLRAALLVLAGASPASAEVRLPAIVGDNMILQQNCGAPLWGWADPGETVTVTGSRGKQASATAADNGRWQVRLDTPTHGGPHTVTIAGKNRITL